MNIWLKLLTGTCAGVLVIVGAAQAQGHPPATPKPSKSTSTWDRIGNIKDVATHIGNIQRSQGADKAMSFIDACYRTHSLGSAYSKSFEGCIVADYLLAQALVAVINRVPADELRKTGIAAPADILKAMQVRVGSAFGQYGIASTEANAVVALTAEHGMPPFMNAVFPNANAAR